MKVFENLQLISMKTRIFNVSLNIFLFNNWKKYNVRRLLHPWTFKSYEERCTEKSFKGPILYETF